jgi:hypothetical protein
MAVQFQNIPVTFKGISQKSPTNLSMPGEMTSATNVQILKGGPNGIEFSKRYGTRQLQALTDSISGVTAVNPLHMTTLGSALVMDNSQAVFTRATVPDQWLTHSRQGFNWASTSENVSQSNYQKTFPSHAYDAASGNEIIAWYDQADRPRYSVRQRATGTWLAHEIVLASPANFAANYKVQAFAPGNGYFYIFAPGTPGNTLVLTQIACTAPLQNSTANTFAFDATTSPFDVQQTPEGMLLIAARSVGLATTIVMLYNPTAGVGTAANVLGTLSNLNVMWLAQDPWPAVGSRSYWLTTVDATNGVKAWQLDATALGITSTTTVDATVFNCNMVGYISSGAPQVLIDVITIGYGHGCYLKFGGSIYQRTVTLASKAFRSNGVWYCLVRYDSPIQPTMWLYDIVGKRTVGKVGLIGAQWSALSNTYGQPPWVTQIGNLAVIAVQAGHESLGSTASNPTGTVIQGIAIVTFDGAPQVSAPAELGGVLHYPGSIPWIFDGAVATESGFNLFPEWSPASPISDGSHASTTHTIGALYGYRATYSWVDAAGNTYESAPSPIVTWTAVSTGNVNVNVATYCLTNRADVSLNLYRDDPTQAGVYRQVNSIPYRNDPTVDTVTIVDDVPDLALDPATWPTRPLLYNGDGSNGQPFEHLPPPSCTLMATAQSRVFLAGVDQDHTAIWVSNEVVLGEGVSYFDSTIVFRVTGKPTAVVGRDRNVVVFTADSIWTVTGEFPDNAGGGFATPTPFKLPHAVGAINPNAIVVTSLGIFFQSKKGLHILGWDWSDNYIGSNIEDSLAGTLITSGLEVPSLHQVRLYTSTGTTFVWDTVFSQWTVFTGQNSNAACNWLDQPTYVDAAGFGWAETPGVYGDAGAFVESTLDFSFIAPAGLRGYHSLAAIQLLGDIKGPHALHAALSYSSQNFPTTFYDAAQAGTTVYGDSTYGVGTYGGAADNVLKMEIRPKKRQSASFKLTLWDSLLSSGASAGFSLQAIVASVGIEGGLARTQASQRMTKA